MKKIFKLDDLHFYYKENMTNALEEINKDYPKIICAFICFNSSLGYDFKIPSQNVYVLNEKIDIKNIFLDKHIKLTYLRIIMKKNKYLIIGGAGYIGLVLLDLLSQDYEIIVFDNFF